MAFGEKRDMLARELERLDGQALSEKKYMIEIEARNIELIMQVKEEYALQE